MMASVDTEMGALILRVDQKELDWLVERMVHPRPLTLKLEATSTRPVFAPIRCLRMELADGAVTIVGDQVIPQPEAA